MKQQFDLSLWLKDKSRKVVTRDGREVRILCIDCGVRKSQPILVEITCSRNTKVLWYYNIDGTTQDKNLNLFFADEEEELTEFEKEVSTLLTDIVYDYESEQDLCDNEYVRNIANKFLDLARKELQPDFDEELDKAYRNQDDVIYRRGKQDALKDLPKWKKVDSNPPKVQYNLQGKRLYKNGEYYIELSDLETLPKEE